MATIIDFDRPRVLPNHWVDHSARTASVPMLRGWLRDLGAIAEALLADDDGPPPQQRVRWVVSKTQEYADSVGGKAMVAFRMGVFATTWVSPILIGRLPPLRRLDHATRIRALHRYESSPLGISLFAVKVFVGVSWFEHPDVAQDVGFDGECLRR